MRFGRRHRYIGIIRGLESGNVTHLPWMTFATEDEAEMWADRMNDDRYKLDPSFPPLTRYGYEPIDLRTDQDDSNL